MAGSPTLNRLAFTATVHCLTGCAIGEVVGMAIGTVFHWSNGATIVLSIVLAFFFGYSLTVRPLLAAGLAPRAAMKLAFASDTVSITIMEIVGQRAHAGHSRRHGRPNRQRNVLGQSGAVAPGGWGSSFSGEPVAGQPGERSRRGSSGPRSSRHN